MNNQWLTIRQLDRQLKEWQSVSKQNPRPRAGWVKTLRAALSMSAEQLAHRLGLTRSRITQLENAETHDAVTLRTLKEVANAMGCEFVYAIVPKDHSSLESIIKKRAEEIATERVTRVAHSMSLEAQSVNVDILKKQKDDLAKKISEHLNKKFWASLETPDTIQEDEISRSAESIYNQIKNSKNMGVDTWEKLIKKNDSAFMSKLKELLAQTNDNKNIQESALPKTLNYPDYAHALKKALIHAKQKEENQKNSPQDNLLKKLIETLQKKK